MLHFDKFLESGIVLSCTPGRLLVGYGAQRSHASPDSDLQVYAPDFCLKTENPWISCEYWSEITLEELQQMLSSHKQEPASWSLPDYHRFSSTFHDLQQRFAKHELKKGVPFTITSASAPMTQQRLKNALSHVLTYAKSHPVNVYGVWNNNSGILGATPEVLFSHHGDMLHTMACAGTRSAAKGSPELLLQDKKERYEHSIVVQDIVDVLSSYGIVAAEEMKLLQLPNLVHLLTPIHVTLKKNMPFDTIVKALHPTPALGASPRQAGWNWLLQQQTHMDRKRFGAPFGYVNARTNESRCYVAIRNVQWDANEMIIAAGCGVVPDSILENEWQEVLNKISAIKHILNL